MELYSMLFIGTATIGILMIIVGIIFRKKLPPWAMTLMILSGIAIAMASLLLCLCLSFFMV